MSGRRRTAATADAGADDDDDDDGADAENDGMVTRTDGGGALRPDTIRA